MWSLTYSDEEYTRLSRISGKNAYKTPFPDLDWAVEKLRTDVERLSLKKERYGYPRKIWKLLDEKPLDIMAINTLGRRGLEIVVTPDVLGKGQVLGPKKIGINDKIRGYDRDITLFHELCHIWYGDEIDHHYSPHTLDNYIIIEWLSRTLRIRTESLRRAVLGFELVPYVYDKVSNEAFHNCRPHVMTAAENLATIEMGPSD